MKNLEEELLGEEVKKFKKEHPEWDSGELREIDKDLRQRHSYRDKSGRVRNIRILNFSDLDTYDEEGNLLPFEDTITYEDSAF